MSNNQDEHTDYVKELFDKLELLKCQKFNVSKINIESAWDLDPKVVSPDSPELQREFSRQQKKRKNL